MPETFALLETASGGRRQCHPVSRQALQNTEGHPRNIISVENVQLQIQQVTTDSVSSLKPLARLMS